MQSTRVFIHGLESTGRGTKGVFFRNRYPDMIIEDFDGSFDHRMQKLESLLAGKTALILVGSSYGGLMAAVYACRNEERVRRLVLLAPALHIESCQPCLDKALQIPVVIFHGMRDEVVPMEAVRKVAERIFKDCRFNTLDDDHVLHNTFSGLDWDTLLGP
jgi:pimeloyl-ACP methyl ester carboxylesterase